VDQRRGATLDAPEYVRKHRRRLTPGITDGALLYRFRVEITEQFGDGHDARATQQASLRDVHDDDQPCLAEHGLGECL
jgi:hypothetical protein